MPEAYGLGIEGRGRVNGMDYVVSGRGRCDPRVGDIAFDVSFSHIAPGCAPLGQLLGVLIIPTVFGREIGQARNLLTIAGGEFSFAQAMAADGIAVESEGSMSRPARRELVWRSRAAGNVRLGEVSAIEPFSAIMLPQGGGKILDVLTIPLIENGARRMVQAVRTFTFRPGAELPERQLRRISIETKVDGARIGVSIHSELSVFPRVAWDSASD
jgi:hypothetical protein